MPLLAVLATCWELAKVNTQSLPLLPPAFKKVTRMKALFNCYPVRNLMLSVVAKKAVVTNDALSCKLRHSLGNDADVCVSR